MVFHPDWPALRAKFTRDAQAFLATASKTGEAVNFYALVDAAQVPELRTAQFLAAPFEHISLFSLTKEHGIAKYGPLLIPLQNGADSPAFKNVLRAMRHGWTVSWLSSPLWLDALAEHLAGHLNGTLADGSDVLVRYYDPRLLPSFLAHLDAPVSGALMAPIGRWGWWDRKLDFVVAEGAGEEVSPAVKQTEVTLQTQEVLAEAAFDELIKSTILDESEADEFIDWLPHAFYIAVSMQVRIGRELGLTKLSDLQLYASLALRVHPDFFELLPEFAHAKAKLAAGEVDMPSLVLTIADEDWDQLGGTGVHALKRIRQDITNELCLTA